MDKGDKTSLFAVQGGVVLLLVAVCANVGYNTASKSLSVDIGGAKRLHALSSAMSACLLLPWMLFILFTRQVDSHVSVCSAIRAVLMFSSHCCFIPSQLLLSL